MLNYRAGLQPSIYVNSKRKKGAAAITPLEFFGEKLQPARIASAQELKAKLDSLTVLKNAQSR